MKKYNLTLTFDQINVLVCHGIFAGMDKCTTFIESTEDGLTKEVYREVESTLKSAMDDIRIQMMEQNSLV